VDIIVKAARRGQRKKNFNKVKQKENSKSRLSCSHDIKFECFYFLFNKGSRKDTGKKGKIR
jgi:hypothetical protein